MAYTFRNQPIASIKLTGVASGLEMSLGNINGQETNANTIVNGIKGLLYIANVHGEEQFYPTEAIRTVKQNVGYSE